MRVIQEHISHPRQSFRFLRFEAAAFEGPPHRHAHLELTWIESGEGLRFVGDSAMPFEAGDLVLIGSNTPHTWVSAHGAGPCIATVLQFTPQFLAQASLPELARLAPIAERAAFGLVVPEPCRAPVTAVLERMRAADDLGRLAGLIDALGRLAAHEAALVPIATSPMRAPDARAADAAAHRRVDRVIGWIHRELRRTLTTAEAAQVAGVSPGSFSRFFRKELGKTFTEYVNDVRCSEACIRLRRSDQAVAHIAVECGFETMSHFNRQFRLRMQATPREFRRSGAAHDRTRRHGTPAPGAAHVPEERS